MIFVIDPPRKNIPEDASPPQVINHIHVHTSASANSTAHAAAVAQAHAGNSLAGCLIFTTLLFCLPVFGCFFCGGMLGLSATAIDEAKKQQHIEQRKTPMSSAAKQPRSITPPVAPAIEQPESPVSVFERQLAEEQRQATARTEADRKNRTHRFSDTSGQFETDALFISRNGKIVTLEKPDGKRITVSIDDLSTDSVEWLRNYRPLK
jgi:hypothetical protein